MSKLLTNENLGRFHHLYGHTLVDQAFRFSLIKQQQLGVNDSLASAFVSQRKAIADLPYDSLINEIELLLKIGKPLAPASIIPGAAPIFGTKVGIQGNPPQLEVLYAGGWHFAQDNGWDAWFTFVPLDTGGFRVANPACRLTGDHGTARRGYETLAQFAGFPAPENLMFQITWFNGSVGNYQGKYSEISKKFLGNAGGSVLFEGSRMPPDKV